MKDGKKTKPVQIKALNQLIMEFGISLHPTPGSQENTQFFATFLPPSLSSAVRINEIFFLNFWTHRVFFPCNQFLNVFYKFFRFFFFLLGGYKMSINWDWKLALTPFVCYSEFGDCFAISFVKLFSLHFAKRKTRKTKMHSSAIFVSILPFRGVIFHNFFAFLHRLEKYSRDEIVRLFVEFYFCFFRCLFFIFDECSTFIHRFFEIIVFTIFPSILVTIVNQVHMSSIHDAFDYIIHQRSRRISSTTFFFFTKKHFDSFSFSYNARLFPKNTPCCVKLVPINVWQMIKTSNMIVFNGLISVQPYSKLISFEVGAW